MRSVPIIVIGFLLILPTAFVNAGGSNTSVISEASWEGPLIAIFIIVAAIIIAKKIRE